MRSAPGPYLRGVRSNRGQERERPREPWLPRNGIIEGTDGQARRLSSWPPVLAGQSLWVVWRQPAIVLPPGTVCVWPQPGLAWQGRLAAVKVCNAFKF